MLMKLLPSDSPFSCSQAAYASVLIAQETLQPNRWCNTKSYAEQVGLYVASSLTVLEPEKTCLHMVTLQPLMAFGVIQGYLFLCNLDLSNTHFWALQLHIKTFFCHMSPNLPLGQISCFLWWLVYKSVIPRRLLVEVGLRRCVLTPDQVWLCSSVAWMGQRGF